MRENVRIALVLSLGLLSAVPMAGAQTHPTRPLDFALSAERGVLIGNSAHVLQSGRAPTSVAAPIATNGEVVLDERSYVGNTYAGKYLRGRIRSSVDGDAFSPSGKIELSNLTSVSGSIFSEGSTVVGAFGLVEGNVTTRSGTLRLTRHSAVLGDVFAGDEFLGERNVLVGGPDDNASGNVDVKGDALIADRSEFFGDVRYEGDLRLVGVGDPTIHGALLQMPRGSLTSPAKLAWRLEGVTKPSIDAGAVAIEVKRKQSLTLAPGAYEALVIERDSSLELGAGVYTFASIAAEPEARIRIDLQAAPNSVEIRVKGRSRFGRRLRMDVRGDPARMRFVAGDSFFLGQDGTWYGTIHGFKKVNLGKHISLTGSAWSLGELILGPYSEVDWVPLAP